MANSNQLYWNHVAALAELTGDTNGCLRFTGQAPMREQWVEFFWPRVWPPADAEFPPLAAEHVRPFVKDAYCWGAGGGVQWPSNLSLCCRQTPYRDGVVLTPTAVFVPVQPVADQLGRPATTESYAPVGPQLNVHLLFHLLDELYEEHDNEVLPDEFADSRRLWEALLALDPQSWPPYGEPLLFKVGDLGHLFNIRFEREGLSNLNRVIVDGPGAVPYTIVIGANYVRLPDGPLWGVMENPVGFIQEPHPCGIYDGNKQANSV